MADSIQHAFSPLQHAIACLQQQIEAAEHNAAINDVEGRHDGAFAAREVAASCRLAVGRLMAEDARRTYGETPDKG